MRARNLEDFPDVNPVGWWITIQPEGQHVYWDGKMLLDRHGNVLSTPDEFLDGFPNIPLDGFYDDSQPIIKLCLVDLPSFTTVPFEKRQEELERLWRSTLTTKIWILDEPQKLLSHEHLINELLQVRSYELLLYEPGSLYKAGRSKSLLRARALDLKAREVLPFRKFEAPEHMQEHETPES
jgi:DNA ligase-1